MNVLCYTFLGALDEKGKKKSFKNPTVERTLNKEEWLKTVRSFNGTDLMDLKTHHFMGKGIFGTKVYAIVDMSSNGGVPIYVEETTYKNLKNVILPFKDLF